MLLRAETADALSGELISEERPLPAPEDAILRMRQAILDGQHWFEALLDAVGRWRLPQETVDGRTYQYLIGGEAFDWLLLAERLLDQVTDLVPEREREALLFEGKWPLDMEDEDFERRLGAAKYSAHLNYLYGVLVEEALQLHVEEEIYKAAYARAYGIDPREDESMYQRVYAKSQRELLAQYYEETGRLHISEMSYSEMKEFTYWLFKLRLRRQDKARVASDTRKGLAMLTRMELAVSQRRHGAHLTEEEFEDLFGSR
ncbi:MAG: hypothetical protein Kow0010_16850 [Dehalococcoidia bacterium]